MDSSINTSKGLYIKNFGCQMNVYDGDRMQEMMSSHNYNPVNDIEDADLIILNTCHIREKATEKIYSELGRIKKILDLKDANTTIAVAGCVAQAEGQELVRRAPMIDLVFGPLTYHQLPKILKSFDNDKSQNRKPIIDIEPPNIDKFDILPNRLGQTMKVSSYLSVQEGCDKFCTFCVVPYTRGIETSRPFSAIKKEALDLINSGAQEIILLGQNVNAWRNTNNTEMDFADLIYELSLLDIKRIRFTTSHPNDMNQKLLMSFKDIDKLQPYLHLPVQSGSDKVLKLMNRNYSSSFYIEIINELKSYRPDIAISGDFIVGFPGEDEKDFIKTLDIVKKIGYAHAYSFKYSPRPGTPAGEMEDQIEETIKSDRLARLQDLIRLTMRKYNEKFLNKNLSVLVEKETSKGFYSGRSPYLQSVHFEADSSCIGKIEEIKITKINDNSLVGEILV